MRVKRYIVDTMPDALSKIRSELGADAVILSTKEMKTGGVLGMFQKKKIEVVAAVETAETSKSKTKSTPMVKPEFSAPAPRVTRQAVPEVYRKSSGLAAGSTANANVNVNASSIASLGIGSAGTGTDVLHTQKQTYRQASSSVLLDERPEHVVKNLNKEESISTNSDSTRSFSASTAQESKETRLLQEISEMKSWLSELARKQSEARVLPDHLETVKRRLSYQEVSIELIDEWIEGAYDLWLASNKSIDDERLNVEFLDSIASFLKERIDPGIHDDTRIVYIAGPTGVGKTTTIAKLAADQIFRAHKKVGFITADTYRISAIEQLRTYATILNVPLEVVQSPGDVHRALKRLEHCDLILMDTAGRNYLNEMFVAELHSLLSPTDQSETYLVLSLTSKTQDMKKITEHFSKYGIEKVIFTKLDETASVGPLFNLLKEYPLKVSYITNGQNVPDDLLTVDQDLLINMLLGENLR